MHDKELLSYSDFTMALSKTFVEKSFVAMTREETICLMYFLIQLELKKCSQGLSVAMSKNKKHEIEFQLAKQILGCEYQN